MGTGEVLFTLGISGEGTHSKQGAYFFIEKQQNVQKELMFILKGSRRIENGLVVLGSF